MQINHLNYLYLKISVITLVFSSIRNKHIINKVFSKLNTSNLSLLAIVSTPSPSVTLICANTCHYTIIISIFCCMLYVLIYQNTYAAVFCKVEWYLPLHLWNKKYAAKIHFRGKISFFILLLINPYIPYQTRGFMIMVFPRGGTLGSGA